MDYQSDLRTCIWPKEDRYFVDGLSEIIFEVRDLIYPSLEMIRENYIFINISHEFMSHFISHERQWLRRTEKKQVVLIAATRLEALANYWYFNSQAQGVVYTGSQRSIRYELARVINGRFLRADVTKGRMTKKEMQIIGLIAQGMQPKSIARIENCSVKTVYSHQRNAEVKLYSKINRIAI
ncbi:ECP biosynthesis operon DNA-binding transcriptional regulator EcpR [Klebsiella spallanzanii]|uniref:ECP biosynthesis operon DNA-binding transcriptional regulator EcpR n=1 Tax=Klebsiella spallanzanii TaxID=2587528 RepID=UPI00115C0F37|nr:LuxR C-terminal-related transcriptional regulator [Klebsiella spallanzanii]VUS63655.1 HTH-type transcriptional regulator EcpR [Klebsiella spallanzanii]